MKTFQIVTLLALVAASMAFSPNQVSQGKFPSESHVSTTFDVSNFQFQVSEERSSLLLWLKKVTNAELLFRFMERRIVSNDLSFLFTPESLNSHEGHFREGSRRCTCCSHGCTRLRDGLYRWGSSFYFPLLGSSIWCLFGGSSRNFPSMSFPCQLVHPNRDTQGWCRRRPQWRIQLTWQVLVDFRFLLTFVKFSGLPLSGENYIYIYTHTPRL